MAGDLRDLKAKLLEAQKAEKKPQAVSQKQEPPRTKLTLKKQTPAASSGASAAPKSVDVKPQLQKKKTSEPSKRPAPKGKGTSLKGFSDLRALRNQINAPQEQKDKNEPQKPVASEKKSSRVLVKVGNEVLRNVPPKLELQESLPVSERADEIAEAIKNTKS